MGIKMSIYLDNHSTTQLDKRVLDAMMPFFIDNFGNPSSKDHIYGWQAEEAIEDAREKIAKLINADPNEIVFVSGATEANNFVLQNCNSVAISSIEHSSIHTTCKCLNPLLKHNEIKVKHDGIIDLEYAGMLAKQKVFNIVSVMLVNNEIGTIQPVSKLRDIFKYSVVHSDMAQALGKIRIDVKELNVDLASFSAHKMYGPKGIGALYISNRVKNKFHAIIYGGGQEGKLRSGTHNVPGIVGFGKACELALNEFESEYDRISKLKHILMDKLSIHNVNFHCCDSNIPGNINVEVPFDNIVDFIARLRNRVAFSFGSACMDNGELSRTLVEIGLRPDQIKRSIRLCIGRFNTEHEILSAADFIIEAIGGKQ